MTDYELYQGDCLEVVPQLEAGSVDAIIADTPYGTTACKWDSVIPFEPMWECIEHVIKPRAVIVLFGSEPFSSALRMSNIKWYKYDWVWDKSKVTGFLNAKKKPLMHTENISVFCSGLELYNPQTKKGKPHKRGRKPHEPQTQSYSRYENVISHGHTSYYPKQVLREFSAIPNGHIHPTQKPVTLMEYLIKTYTNEGDTVLDFTMGSGTTGVACARTGRKFIGIEMDDTYFELASKRIWEAYQETPPPKELDNGMIQGGLF